MRRRSVVIGAAALLLVQGHPSAQQAPAKIPRVGILTQADNERAPILGEFRAGLRDLGYVEGRNIAYVRKVVQGGPETIPSLATELVNLNVDVIVTAAPPLKQLKSSPGFAGVAVEV